MKPLLSFAAACCLLLAVPDFKPYPGAKLDEKASHQASSGTTQCEVYTTADNYEKIYAFYKGLYKEAAFAPPAPALPSGQKVRWSFFILDGGKDLAHSRFWLKIQRPYIATVSNDGQLDFKDIRDLSLIQTIRRP